MIESQGKGIPLHTKILLGLILGAAAGLSANYLTRPSFPEHYLHLFAVQPEAGFPVAVPLLPGSAALLHKTEPAWLTWTIEYVMRPAGDIFRRMLFMTVVPLVFASLAVGVAQLGAMGSLGRIGAKTFVYFVITMTIAVVIGLTLVNLVNPGQAVSAETRDRLMNEFRSDAEKKSSQPVEFGISTFVNIVPSNPLEAMVRMDMLAVIFFALLIGIGMTKISPEHSRVIQHVLQGVTDLMVVIIGWAMIIAPFGVFALIFTITARFGFEILGALGLYVMVVLAGLFLQMFGVLSILIYVFSRMSPLVFFRKVRAVIITAFSTSSSNATLPTTMKVTEEELGVPGPIAGFVIPLGATMNMNGTALFEGVTVVFLAQVFGVELTLSQQIIVVVMAVVTAIGAAGVPSGSLPLLIMVLAMVKVPPIGIALILGVDRILDMCRTTLNVVGDISAATYVARSEGHPLKTT